jgi:hypothetical protein
LHVEDIENLVDAKTRMKTIDKQNKGRLIKIDDHNIDLDDDFELSPSRLEGS